MSLYAKLSSAFKAEFSPGDDVQEYLKGLLTKSDTLNDKQWGKLHPSVQTWINEAATAVDNDEDIEEPEGLPTEADDEDEDDEADAAPEADEDDDEADEEEETKPVKTAKNGKSAKAAKPEPKAKGKAAKPEKAAKPAKGAKEAKPAKKGNGAKKLSGPRPRSFEDKQVITVLSEENPKRAGSASYDRFELYSRGKKGMTVRDALDKGVTSGDLAWDTKHGFIKIS